MDTDLDGMLNMEEAVAGTDPQDASSLFAIGDLDTSGSNCVLFWPSVSNRSYSVYGFTNLVEPVLIPLGTNLPATPQMNVWKYF